MSDDLTPPVPPAGQAGLPVRQAGLGRAANGEPRLRRAAKGSLLENFRQLLTKGIHLLGRQALPRGEPLAAGRRKNAGKAGPQSLFASPIRLQGMDSVKQLLATGIDLDSVNKVLAGALVILMVYAITVGVNKKFSVGKLMQSILHIKFEKSTSEAVEAYQPVDYYLGQVRGRDIFNPVGEVKTQAMPEPLPPPEPPKPKLKEMVSGLSVVGIAWGETPKAMIQDAATQEIYFLKKDDRIGKTEIKVKDILRGKVVIGYGEEEMDL